MCHLSISFAGSAWCVKLSVYFSETGQGEGYSGRSAVSSFRDQSQEEIFIPLFLGSKKLLFLSRLDS